MAPLGLFAGLSQVVRLFYLTVHDLVQIRVGCGPRPSVRAKNDATSNRSRSFLRRRRLFFTAGRGYLVSLCTVQRPRTHDKGKGEERAMIQGSQDEGEEREKEKKTNRAWPPRGDDDRCSFWGGPWTRLQLVERIRKRGACRPREMKGEMKARRENADATVFELVGRLGEQGAGTGNQRKREARRSTTPGPGLVPTWRRKTPRCTASWYGSCCADAW